MTLIFFRHGRKSLESVKYNNYTVHGLENSLFLAESKFFNNCIFVSIIVQQRDPVSRPSSRYIFCFFCIFSGESVQLLHLLSNFCFCYPIFVFALQFVVFAVQFVVLLKYNNVRCYTTTTIFIYCISSFFFWVMRCLLAAKSSLSLYSRKVHCHCLAEKIIVNARPVVVSLIIMMWTGLEKK